MAFRRQAIAHIEQDRDEAQGSDHGSVEKPHVHEGLGRDIRGRPDLRTRGPVDNLQGPTGDHGAETAGRLCGERHGRKKCTFLATSGLMFVLVADIGHHRTVADVCLGGREALDNLYRDQQRQDGLHFDLPDRDRVGVLGEPADQP